MANLSDTLRAIHRLRVLARDLQDEINRAPIQLKARQAVVAKANKARDDARENLKKLQVTTREREADLKAQHKQLERYRDQLSSAVDQKAYDALKHEIAAGEARCNELEETILTTMTEAEELAPKIPPLEAAAVKAQADFEVYTGSQKERLAVQTEELKKAIADLKVAEEPLTGDIKIEYQRRVTSYGADALASAAGNSCSQCHTNIAQQVLLQLQMGHFVTCTSCYRVLYLAE
jgi:predicted  nucleic acid-binding Zn-ribbon protein